MLYSHVPYHNDTILKTQWQRQTQEVFFNKILPLTLLQEFEKVAWGFTVRGSWRSNITAIFWPLTLMAVTLCLSCSLGLLNRRPRAHSAGCWLSLQHLISIFSGRQTPSGFARAPSVGCGFPYHIFSSPTGTRTPLSPSVKFVGLILPLNSHAEIWTRLHASAISSDIWRSGCVTSAIFGMACVIVIERK